MHVIKNYTIKNYVQIRIPVVAANVESHIELQQKLFIPMLFIGHKL